MFNAPSRTLSIVNMGRPIHELSYNQVMDLYTTDAFDPEIVQLPVDHGIVPRSSWNS